MKEVERDTFFLGGGGIFHYGLDHDLQFESFSKANYEIKLLVIKSGKKGDNTDILLSSE